MSKGLETQPAAGVMELISGIIIDVHILVRQQLALFRYEVKSEIGRVLDAGYLVAVGAVIAVMGGLLLCGMLVHLLAWMAPSLPLWGCYGIVGAPITVVGGILCMVGMQRFRNFNIPTVTPPQDLEENVDG